MLEFERYNKLYQALSFNNNLIHVNMLLQRAAINWPNNYFVICEGKRVTYKEAYYLSIILAERLRDLGIKPGQRVILYYENSIEFFIAYFAIWQVGAIVAPLNVFLHQEEIFHIINDSTPSLIIVSPTLKKNLEGFSGNLPPIISDIDVSKAVPTHIPSIKIPDRDIDEVVALLYTSGTTGFPKAVMLSSKNILINTIQAVSRFEIASNEKIFCALPLFHAFPLSTCLWSGVVTGSTSIITPKIDRHSLIKGLKYKPTVVIGVPVLYGLFCKLRSIKFPKVRYFFSGGDVLNDKIRAYFELIYRRKVCNGYGLTETSPFVSVDTDDYVQVTDTVGRPFIGIEIQVRDGDGNVLKNGEIGILWIKGPNIMLGYYNHPEATAEVIKDGWFNTGDLAYIDANKKIVIAGREKDLIKHKGVKIFPQEIENILLNHPSVTQAGVIGVLDAQGEEIPVAFVASSEPDHEKLKAELLDICHRHLAPYKIPRQFYIKRELPMTATGKVDKKKLRAELTLPRTAHPE